MKKVPVLLLGVLCCLIGFTQKKLLTYEYDFSPRDYIATTTITNEDKNGFLLSIRNKNSIQRILVNEAGKSISLLEQCFKHESNFSTFKYHAAVSDTISNLYKKCNFIGGKMDDEKIIEILRGKISRTFYFLETNLRTGVTILSDTLYSEDSEKIIACLDLGRKVFMLTYITNSNQLSIWEKHVSTPVIRTHLKVTLPNLGKVKNNSLSQSITEFSDIFRKSNFAVYENNMRYPVLFTAIRNKAYVQNDKIIFTVSSNKLNTYAIAVDIVARNYTLTTFDQDEMEEENTGHATTASLLVDSLLVTCHAKSQKLKLNLFNVRSGEKLKSIEINESSISSIANNEIQKTGSFLSKSDIRSADFDKFYKTAIVNELSMSGYIEHGNLYLSFAAPYKQLITGTTLLNVALTASGTYFINAAPNSYGYFISTMPAVKNPTYIGFETTIDTQTLNFTKKQADFSAWDRIIAFLQTKELEIKKCQFFYMNNHYYIGYPVAKENRFFVYRFDEKASDN